MGSLRTCAVLLVIAGLLGAASAVVNPGARAVLLDIPRDDEITIGDAKALGASALWLDARSRAAFEQGHVDGALLLNEDHWEELFVPVIERWRPGLTIVVYCDSTGCQASRKVADRLRTEAGVEPVKVLHGDWSRMDATR